MNQQSSAFSDLSFDRMWSATADKDRETTVSIGVYRGRATLVVFAGRGGPPKLRLPLPRQHNVLFRQVFNTVRKSGPDSSITIPVQEWDPQMKKMNSIASVTFGFDSSNQPYLGLTATGFSATKFPIRTDLKWDVSGIQELNSSALAVDSFLSALDNTIQAMNLTNFKFDPAQKSGSGGRGNVGGQSSNSGGQSSFKGAIAVIEDEIPF